MAVLSAAERATVTAYLMQQVSSNSETVAITKDVLRAAIDAADSWVDANAASFNSALPAQARTGLTVSQKSRILAWVVLRRFEVS